MTMPRSMMLFERLSLLSLALEFAAFIFYGRELLAQEPGPTQMSAQMSSLAGGVILAITLCLFAGLILLISRKRSSVAKWIFMALFAGGLVWEAVEIDLLLSHPVGYLVLYAVGVAIQLAAFWLLFTKAGRDYMAGA